MDDERICMEDPNAEAAARGVLCKKGVLRKKSLVKKRSGTSCEFCEISKNTFFVQHL